MMASARSVMSSSSAMKINIRIEWWPQVEKKRTIKVDHRTCRTDVLQQSEEKQIVCMQ